MKNIFVAKKGIVKLFKSIKEHKATGPDGIPGRLLKICANELAGVFKLNIGKKVNRKESQLTFFPRKKSKPEKRSTGKK